MILNRTKIAVALLSGALVSAAFAAQDNGSRKGSETPIATVRSSSGLILNGVRTPPGVTSVVVLPGDVVDTLGGNAVATFADGRTVTLSAGTQYSVAKNTGTGVITAGHSNGLNTKVSRQLNISGHK